MKKIIFICLCLLCFCSCGKKEELPENSPKANIPVEKKIAIKEIEKILDDELYVLWNKDKISDVTNNERLTLGIKKYAKINDLDYYSIENISTKEVETAFKTTSIGDLTLNHENIRGSINLDMCEHTKWYYNAQKGEYTINVMDAHGGCTAKEIYRKLIDFKEENDKYIATYKLMFDYGCEGDITTIYGSYEDAINERNKLAEIDHLEQAEKGYEAAIASRYEKIEDKLAIYTYTFEKINSKITLVDFKRK